MRKLLSVVSIFMLLAQLFVLNVPTVSAFESTGYKSPALATSTGAGKAWINPINGASSDNKHATVSGLWFGQKSNNLRFSDFGFNIPEDATINNINLEIEKRKKCLIAFCNNKLLDHEVLLFIGNSNLGGNKASVADWGTSDSVATYSWGPVIDAKRINRSDFGASVSAITHSNNWFGEYTAYVDAVRLSVGYTPKDKVPPTIYGIPGDITKEATGPSGAIVSFASPTGTDDVDGTVPVSCNRVSGSLFSIGQTNVICNASDSSGNFSSSSFRVTVRDTVAPEIVLMGESKTQLEYGKEFTDPGAAWFDVVDGEGVVVNVSGSVNHLAVGTYVLRYNFLDSSNNLAEEKTRIVEVVPKKIAVKAVSVEKVVGQTDPDLTYHFAEDSLLDGDFLSGKLVRAAGETAGQYEIFLGTLGAGANYEILYESATLTIRPGLTSAAPFLTNSGLLSFGFDGGESVIQGISIENESDDTAEIKGAISEGTDYSGDTEKNQGRISELAELLWILLIIFLLVIIYLTRNLFKGKHLKKQK